MAYPLISGVAAVSTGGLTQTATAVTTANVSAAVNTHYVCTLAGLTADRNFVLPASAEAGDRIRVTSLDGDADYELILIGATGVTINGGSAATEWSRLFIAGETVELENTGSDNWQVIHDARKPQYGLRATGYTTSGGGQTVSSGGPTLVELVQLIADPYGLDDGTYNGWSPRRNGRYRLDLQLNVEVSGVSISAACRALIGRPPTTSWGYSGITTSSETHSALRGGVAALENDFTLGDDPYAPYVYMYYNGGVIYDGSISGAMNRFMIREIL